MELAAETPWNEPATAVLPKIQRRTTTTGDAPIAVTGAKPRTTGANWSMAATKQLRNFLIPWLKWTLPPVTGQKNATEEVRPQSEFPCVRPHLQDALALSVGPNGRVSRETFATQDLNPEKEKPGKPSVTVDGDDKSVPTIRAPRNTPPGRLRSLYQNQSWPMNPRGPVNPPFPE